MEKLGEEEYREYTKAGWSKKNGKEKEYHIRVNKVEWIGARKVDTINKHLTRRAEWSGFAEIKGEKLELHVQDIVGKRKLEHSNRDGITRFNRGI